MATAAHLISSNLPSVKQLQCFLAVAYALNFRQAAERLNMTQPPLTRHIQSLEALLHQQLFSRSTHAVSLTEDGRSLVARAEKILADLDALSADALSRPHPLRIGLTRTLDFTRIAPVAARLAQLDAGDEIDSPDLTSARLLQCLAQNRLDLVLTGEKGAGEQENVRYRWICREPLLIALPTTHPASRQQQVSLDAVSDLPLFWFARRANPAFFDKCEQVFAKLKTPLKKVNEPDDSLTMLAHIARGKGFALLPQSKCAFNQEGLCYRPLRDDQAQRLHIDVYAATRRDDARPALLQALEKLSDGAP